MMLQKNARSNSFVTKTRTQIEGKFVHAANLRGTKVLFFNQLLEYHSKAWSSLFQVIRKFGSNRKIRIQVIRVSFAKPEGPTGWGLKVGIFFTNQVQTMILQVMVVDIHVGIEFGKDPFEQLIVIWVSELDVKALRPTLEPSVRALHVGVSASSVDLTSARLYLLESIQKKITVFENQRKSRNQYGERSELRLHFEWTKVN